MGGAMIHSQLARFTQLARFNRPARRSRRGLGILEVIVCTGLVAIMIIPIAAVIRSSSQSIARSEGSPSTQAELRRTLRWLSNTIRDSDVVSVSARRLQLHLDSGEAATVEVRRGKLWLDDGNSRTTLADNVRNIRFTEWTLTTPPRTRIGISMTLQARDPVSRNWVSVDATVALPPQF